MIYIFWLIESRSQPLSLSENSMSYPPPPTPTPPPPPPSIIPLTFPVCNVRSFMPQGPVDNKHSDSQSQYVHAPLIMRRNLDNHPSNSAPFPSINPKMSQANIFYKTRKCAKFEKGNCLIAENCNYAHGDEDMREPPPNWRELICENDKGAGNKNDDQQITNSRKICWTFNKRKKCKYGEKCRYLHLHEGPSKVTTVKANPLAKECSAIHIRTMGPMMEHRRETEQTKLNMCRMWEITAESGNRIEANVMATVGSIPTEALPVIVNDAVRTGTVVGPPTQEEEEKFLIKRKVKRKITGIYGDWLDDHIAPEKLPNTRDG